jgi:hypothetical protein
LTSKIEEPLCDPEECAEQVRLVGLMHSLDQRARESAPPQVRVRRDPHAPNHLKRAALLSAQVTDKHICERVTSHARFSPIERLTELICELTLSRDQRRRDHIASPSQGVYLNVGRVEEVLKITRRRAIMCVNE